jgi:hypothetical protein
MKHKSSRIALELVRPTVAEDRAIRRAIKSDPVTRVFMDWLAETLPPLSLSAEFISPSVSSTN